MSRTSKVADLKTNRTTKQHCRLAEKIYHLRSLKYFFYGINPTLILT